MPNFSMYTMYEDSEKEEGQNQLWWYFMAIIGEAFLEALEQIPPRAYNG